MNTGLKVKLNRVAKDIQQQDLAKRVGITPQYLRLIENGKAENPSKKIMCKIAEELNSTVQELFFDE